LYLCRLIYRLLSKALLAGIALAGLVGLSLAVILWPRATCDGIFEQTAPSLAANLELIKHKGAFAVRREKIQELSEGAQKVGLHLKTCCSVLNAGKLDAKQFQECLSKASAYEKQVALVAQHVTEAADAMEKGATAIARKKVTSANTAAQQAINNVKNLDAVTGSSPGGNKETPAPQREKGKGIVTTSTGSFHFERITGMSMGGGKLTVKQFGTKVEIPLARIRKITFLGENAVKIGYVDGNSEDTEFFCYWNTPVTFHSGDKKIYYGDCPALKAVQEIEFFPPS
jgi:hypothetical protein